MKLYKAKAKTKTNQKVVLEHKLNTYDCAVKVQSVYYSGKSPQHSVRILDADGDRFMFDMSGAAEQAPTTPEVPVTVKLPLSVVDTEGENEVVIMGEAYILDHKLVSNL